MTPAETQERIDLGFVETLLLEMRRESRRASETKLVVPLTMSPPHVVELESTPAAALRLSVGILQTDGWTETSRQALAVFLERVDASVRLAQVVVENSSVRFEVSFVSEPSEAELTDAFAALEATTCFHIHEARALEDEALARLFLSTNNPQRR